MRSLLKSWKTFIYEGIIYEGITGELLQPDDHVQNAIVDIAKQARSRIQYG